MPTRRVNIQNHPIPLLAQERPGENPLYFPATVIYLFIFLEEKKKKKTLGELILNVRHCSFVVQLLPSNPVFVLLTIATEAFHFIYLLFISLRLPEINAKHGSEAFFVVVHFHTLDTYLDHFVLLILQFKKDEAHTITSREG